MSKKELRGELQLLQEEIASLKKQLNILNEKKESFFQRKEALRKEILSFIKEVKNKRTTKDQSHQSIKEIK